MKNFIQPGNTLTVTAPADVVSDGFVVVGSLFGVAAFSAASGQPVEIDTVGVFEIPKVLTDVITAGEKLYWDSGAAKLTKTPGTGSKPLVGYASEGAGNGVATVRVNLHWTGQTGPS